ncbi:hypothetical protein IYY11_16760 [Methylocystis sp. H62]|uniref:hypothetical protein n=1 Tax=Methylocystis sp. H62 TaxID=2785789 RepID=UPI0018C2BB4C|nr:hypothetical protein [Methylocystis sp. H62]MBG0795007.1 hypothetical protein [Methylocystis sp. H62]
MSITSRESAFRETAAYGGLIDAIGGLATVIIAIVGLSGVNAPMMASIATIVFGVALLIQGGAMLSEYAQIIFPAGSRTTNVEGFGGSSLSVVFLVGAAGIVLGILSLLGVEPATLTPIAAIAFGSALVLSSNAVWQLHVLGQESLRSRDQIGAGGGEILASELAFGSAGIQALSGLAVIVLGILAIAGAANDLTLNLVALLALGATVVFTGGSLSATLLSFMRSH